jgi:hypothetical protein
MEQNKSQVLPGTLNLMILKTLETLGPLHGYGIARRIKQIGADLLSDQSRDNVSRSFESGVDGMDILKVGRFGKQPASEVLLDYACRTEAAGS